MRAPKAEERRGPVPGRGAKGWRMTGNTATAPAAITIRATTATSKWLGAASLGSGKEIAVGDQVVMCPKCFKPVLLDDWRGNDNKCPDDQTPGRVIERATRGEGA